MLRVNQNRVINARYDSHLIPNTVLVFDLTFECSMKSIKIFQSLGILQWITG